MSSTAVSTSCKAVFKCASSPTKTNGFQALKNLEVAAPEIPGLSAGIGYVRHTTKPPIGNASMPLVSTTKERLVRVHNLFLGNACFLALYSSEQVNHGPPNNCFMEMFPSQTRGNSYVTAFSKLNFHISTAVNKPYCTFTLKFVKRILESNFQLY